MGMLGGRGRVDIAIFSELSGPDAFEALRSSIPELPIAFFDGAFSGLAGNVAETELADLHEILASEIVGRYEIALDAHRLAHRFAAIGGALCLGCNRGDLAYLPTFAFDGDGDQVACRDCGAMFAADGFFSGQVAHLRFGETETEHARRWCFDPLHDMRFLIGRATSCDVCIHSPHIARAHLDLFFENTTFFARDLGGSNGTSLAGEMLPPGRPRPLEHGDIITLPADRTLRVSLTSRG